MAGVISQDEVGQEEGGSPIQQDQTEARAEAEAMSG